MVRFNVAQFGVLTAQKEQNRITKLKLFQNFRSWEKLYKFNVSEPFRIQNILRVFIVVPAG
jgi:hypothetical protein